MKKGLLLSTLLVATAVTGWGQPGGTFDPRVFGAKADGRTLDTPALQAAIDACAKAGGGTVNLTNGVFLSGTLRLRSHVTLCVATGAVLRGSADIADYPSITPQIEFLYRARFTKSLIFAERQENIALTGAGVIDGQGKLFPARKGDDGQRPYLIRFSECRNVRVRDLHLQNSARWLSHYLACEDVSIEGVSIDSRIRENRDGMDIDSCDGVRIAGCNINSGDDSIVLKATANRPCRHVAVTNCTLSSGASALKLGTESQGGFADVTFENCVVHDTNGDGISVEEVDGGVCERVRIINIVMRNVHVPIFIRLGNRANPLPGQPKPGVGRLRDVTITDVEASGAAANGCSITGLPGRPVENVTLRNIRIRFAGGGTARDAALAVPEKETAYPKGSMFGTLPAYGFFCRHAEGLRLHNLTLACAKDEARPALIADDVRDLDVLNLCAQPATGALIRLNDVQGAQIHGCQLKQEQATFLSVTGEKTRAIKLRDNDLHAAKQPLVKTAEVTADAIILEP